jgi:hypothetical protein
LTAGAAVEPAYVVSGRLSGSEDLPDGTLLAAWFDPSQALVARTVG